eukprot:CAMPEP_0168573646 /NCGR_PEP_ID=MMETSP0413-20121227/18649_1 /TAXON_ID=136452 /ORGANISM="Filamoeba nolandi, Strain NC-AS-23-1" /LENGTH=883 /DNA_ID=CAMNT_0008606917 /DNA_START=68 /DNA_END=2719 /DNA_ORIENTATION=+
MQERTSAGAVNFLQSRCFATQSRGPIPLKYDAKFNSYFGVAHPSNWKPAIKVTVTGSSGQIGYNLVGRIASGEVFGKDQPVHLTLLESIETDRDSYGVFHELADGTYPLLHSLQKLQSDHGAFDGADYVILSHAKPATEIEDDVLRKVFHKQEEWEAMDAVTRRKMKQVAIEFYNLHAAFLQSIQIQNMANLDVKILVVTEPVARICNLVSHFVPRLPEKYITGLSRTQHNRFTAMLAREFQCKPSDIENAFVWGSTADTYIPDFSSVLVKGKPLQELVKGDFESWKHRMIDTFIKRGTQIHDYMKDSTTALANDMCVSWRVLSQQPTLAVKFASDRPTKVSPIVAASSAAAQHLHDWIHGSNGKWTSMVVSSDNHYGIEPGQFASMPVVCENGEYKIVENLQLEPWLEHRMKQHYEAETNSCVQDIEDFVEYCKWLIDIPKNNSEKFINFPSPQEVSNMDQETQKIIRRRITLLNPAEAALHDRSWYPKGFEVNSTTGIMKGPKNKFPDTWSTKGEDLDAFMLIDGTRDVPVFTEEDELFMFDYRKALLQGKEAKEWWPKWLEFKEKTKDPKGLAQVYEGILETLLEIENKTGNKVFTPESLQMHRQKIEEIRNSSPEMKRVQETFNELEQAMIPDSAKAKDTLPQQRRPNQAAFVPPDAVEVKPLVSVFEQVLLGKTKKEFGKEWDPLRPRAIGSELHTNDFFDLAEKARNAQPPQPYPEKSSEEAEKEKQARDQKQSEEEEDKRKAREEKLEQEEEDEDKWEVENIDEPTYEPTFWLREFEKEYDPFIEKPGEKPEDFLAPQHRALFDVIQEAEAEGITGEIRQELHLSPEDMEFAKKQIVPGTNIIDLSYIPKEGIPLRNLPPPDDEKDEEGEEQQQQQ